MNMDMQIEEAIEEQALSFARTLRGKNLAEAVGQLMLAFEGMDLVSAKAVLAVVSCERDGAA